MKNIISLMLAATMAVFMLAGCNNADNSRTASGESSGNVEETVADGSKEEQPNDISEEESEEQAETSDEPSEDEPDEPGESSDDMSEETSAVSEPKDDDSKDEPIEESSEEPKQEIKKDPGADYIKYLRFRETGKGDEYAIAELDNEFKGAIVLPEKYNGKPVTSIDMYAFRFCYGLESVTFTKNIKVIENLAFENCTGLKSVTFRSGLKDIGAGAFEGCESLESIQLPESVVTIGNGAFSKCVKLNDITLGDKLTNIDIYAFDGCGYYNDDSHWENNVLYIGKYLIKAKTELSGEYSVKEGTRLLADNAFDGCWNVNAINLPEGLVNISDNAFLSCSNLKGTFVIPDSVKSIGNSAFSNCGITDIVIGKGVTSIGEAAFSHSRFKSVVIPGNVKVIKRLAFNHSGDLAEVVFNEGLEKIEGSAFIYCPNIESITIPASVKEINTTAFGNCAKFRYAYCVNKKGWHVTGQYEPKVTDFDEEYMSNPEYVAGNLGATSFDNVLYRD